MNLIYSCRCFFQIFGEETPSYNYLLCDLQSVFEFANINAGTIFRIHITIFHPNNRSCPSWCATKRSNINRIICIYTHQFCRPIWICLLLSPNQQMKFLTSHCKPFIFKTICIKITFMTQSNGENFFTSKIQQPFCSLYR